MGDRIGEALQLLVRLLKLSGTFFKLDLYLLDAGDVAYDRSDLGEVPVGIPPRHARAGRPSLFLTLTACQKVWICFSSPDVSVPWPCATLIHARCANNRPDTHHFAGLRLNHKHSSELCSGVKSLARDKWCFPPLIPRSLLRGSSL
jgi:hypothetical protein